MCLAPSCPVPAFAAEAGWKEPTDSTGEITAIEESLARGGRQCGGSAVGLAWIEDRLASRTSCIVRPQRVAAGSIPDSADLAGGGDEAAHGELNVGEAKLDPAVPTGTLLCAGQEEEFGGEGEAHETVVWQSRAVEAPSGAVQVERVEDLEVSNSGEDAHGAFPLRVGVVLNLKLEARGFWRDELRHLQIMHLELEAVFKTPQVFLHELRIRVDALVYDWGGENNWINPLWGLWTKWHTAAGGKHWGHGGVSLLAGPVVGPGAGDDRQGGGHHQADLSWSGRPARICILDDGAEEWLQLSEKLTRTERHQEAEEHDDVAPKGIRATLSPPYSSAMNNYHEDMGLPGPAKGDLCGVNGMVRLQMAASETMGATVTERMWLLAKHACTYVVLTILSFGRPDTGTLLQQENAFMEEEGVKMVLTQEKCKNHQRKKRQLSFHWWGVERPWELLKLWTWCRDEA
ncbi:hypothetical protein CYMTET_52798 [Cymbomonas tetramitiformis]|uniref:Uncharacterized protein n=1 Tax=Cymbomonas tetramitiformis TaxID=36881 RepID=A0AAE0BI98_9CHLO|nr:hypothetical protein CYMTET_52798 [Cymbomonas tetramitiformis]